MGDDGGKLDLSKDRRCRCRISVPDDPEWLGGGGGITGSWERGNDGNGEDGANERNGMGELGRWR